MVQAVIYEMDTERDRKTCVALDLKVTGANRELAQWLLDHPQYPERVVAGWLGCGKSRIGYLRRWAQNNFVGSPMANPSDPSKVGHRGGQHPLETKDNSEEQDAISENHEVADPATIEDNALYTIGRMNEHARVFKKLFKVSSFDRETKVRISTAIERMIQKWRSTQATLTKKG